MCPSELRGGSAAVPDGLHDLPGFRETVGGGLGEDQLTIHHDVEDTSGTPDERRGHSERLLDLGRQTGGPWKVVSNDAVRDGNFHD